MNEDDDRRRSVERVSMQREVPIPPPPGFISPFKTVGEWLGFIIEHDHRGVVEEYRIDLYESSEPLLSLTGYAHKFEQGMSISRLAYQPSQHMFFALPRIPYGNSLPEIKKKVRTELIDFVSTPEFNASFLSKAYYISTNFTGEIWRK